jgi:hypothetical protein
MSDPASTALSQATWLAAWASIGTAAILGITLGIAWANLTAFKSADRVKRTTDLFFNFYTQQYFEENSRPGAPPLISTPYMAINSLVEAPGAVKPEIALIVHNYLEAIAALHWKNLIDSNLYFDSFANIIVSLYPSLTHQLDGIGSPLTPFSRIPKLHKDAQAYLTKRKTKLNRGSTNA